MSYENVTAVLPSLNPDKTLCQVVDSLLDAGFRDIILINDGSDEAHREPFETAAQHPEVTLLTHEVNRGKGAAMKTAFQYILDSRPDSAGAVTVDGDGQHTAKDVRACAEKLVENQDKVILGCRDFSGPEVPWKSRFGNLITRSVFRLFCGMRISDTQTGLRAIPRSALPLMLETKGDRYEYETEMFFALKQAQVGILEQRIETVYEPGNPSSHFHPVRDAWRIYRRIFAFSLRTPAAFALSSLAAFLIDNVLFNLFNLHLMSPKHPLHSLSRSWRLQCATYGARAVSSLFNYTVNRTKVFHSEAPAKRTILRYYILCVAQAVASAGLLSLFTALLPDSSWIIDAVVKPIVDVLLFFVSYPIQKRWVFK